uniref:Transcription factor domain-containing protein n=1 Tax=Bionectria ochroleuca TaxID=29856 RepID=A0A8H7NH16_BIOOC
MGEKIKKSIRVGANARRSKGELPFHVTSQQDYSSRPGVLEVASFPEPGAAGDQSGSSGQQVSRTRSSSASPNTGFSHISPGFDEHVENIHPEERLAALGPAWEQDFTMIFIDFVFPLLFPFYRPPAVATSRAWLLSFVKQNRATTHAVLSLSSFFFTFGLADVFPGKHDACRYTMWGQVVDQARMAFGMLNVDLASMMEGGRQPTLLERARMMATIVHLMIFDLFVGRTSDWEVHLAPALQIFQDIANDVGLGSNEEVGISVILEAMNWPRPYFPGFQLQLWNPDQANFRFFSALLIVIDILASTSLQRVPRLSHLHGKLLGNVPPEEINQPLDLFSFVGCQNWVLLVIGEIAALDARKRDEEMNQDFDRKEFDLRAGRVLKTLESGLKSIIGGLQSIPIFGSSLWYQPGHSNCDGVRSLVPTRIYAHAAHIYLQTVIEGPNLKSSSINWHTNSIAQLIRELHDPSQMRTLAWPICIAGCFSWVEEEQQRFQSSLASVETFNRGVQLWRRAI